VKALVGLQKAINFNGGGHINHTIFWTNLAPPKAGGGVAPEGKLAKYIDKDFGSFEVRPLGAARAARAGARPQVARTCECTRLCDCPGV
jgi:superoxide dismutase